MLEEYKNLVALKGQVKADKKVIKKFGADALEQAKAALQQSQQG